MAVGFDPGLLLVSEEHHNLESQGTFAFPMILGKV